MLSVERKGELAECLAVTLAYLDSDRDSIKAFTQLYSLKSSELIANCSYAYKWYDNFKTSMDEAKSA